MRNKILNLKQNECKIFDLYIKSVGKNIYSNSTVGMKRQKPEFNIATCTEINYTSISEIISGCKLKRRRNRIGMQRGNYQPISFQLMLIT